MDIASANDALKAIELPSWIRDVRWVEDLDSDNEPLLRVMLVVDEAIDVDAIFDELQSVKGQIRDALKTAGIATWVSIVLDSPVAE